MTAPREALARLIIDDWHHVLRRAWSVRLLAISFLLDGAEVAINVMTTFEVPPPIAPGRFALLAGAVTIAAAVARFIAQPQQKDA